jgi:hypothetical protein
MLNCIIPLLKGVLQDALCVLSKGILADGMGVVNMAFVCRMQGE